jgi:lysophospholipase L1-like esterase
MACRFVKLYQYIATFLLTSIIIVVSGHYVLELPEHLHSTAKVDPRSLAIDTRAYMAVYSNNPEREEMFEYSLQDRTHFEPYIHFRRYPIITKRVHVDQDGVRKTIKSPKGHAKKVFVMGGSTVWGTGASDDMTIPSLLQHSLGIEYDVYNFGETGYVSTQELNQLLKKLADGDIPDYVIFYDGNNDGYAGAYSPALPRDPQNLRQEAAAREKAEHDVVYRVVHDWYEPSNYAKLLWRLNERRLQHWDESIADREAMRAKRVVSYYDAHVRQVKALAKEYGFKAYFFWQANMFNPLRKPVSYEKDILETASPVFVESQRQVYYEAKKAFEGRENEGIYFIADIFNDLSEPVFLDWSHTSMEGNKIVADKMFASMKQEMRR